MIKRLALGLGVGGTVGLAVAGGLHFALGLKIAAGLLMYLLAMGVGATAGVLAGKPPWRQEAWLESILKAVAGLAFGALITWLATSYVPWSLPFAALGLPTDARLAQILLVMLPLVGGLFGALVGLDNTAEGEKKQPKRARVAALPEVDAIPEPVMGKKGRKGSL